MSRVTLTRRHLESAAMNFSSNLSLPRPSLPQLDPPIHTHTRRDYSRLSSTLISTLYFCVYIRNCSTIQNPPVIILKIISLRYTSHCVRILIKFLPSRFLSISRLSLARSKSRCLGSLRRGLASLGEGRRIRLLSARKYTRKEREGRGERVETRARRERRWKEVEGGGLVAISWYYLHLPWSALAVTDALYLISGHTAGYIGTSIPVYISPFRR